jgi:hypothetical protein
MLALSTVVGRAIIVITYRFIELIILKKESEMNNLVKSAIFLMCFSFLCFAQIDDVQFTDMGGNSYDLHEILNNGKHVLCHFTFNG